MANEAVGTVQHQCGNVADVRKNKKGRLYLACPHCGLLMMAMQGGQEWILDNMQPLAAPPPPAPPAPPPAPIAAPAPTPKPAEPAPKKSRGWAPLI